MKQIDLKAKFLGLMLLTIAASGSVLTACSKGIQTQAQAPASTMIGSSPSMGGIVSGMKQGGMMDHSMMDLGPADAEFDLRFIDSMIPHHEGAVIMAKEGLQKSKRPELKQLAQTIIKAQEKEISQMKQWRAAWYPKAPKVPVAWHAQMGHSMMMSEAQLKSMQMNRDLGGSDADFDQRFVDAMIPHHQGAVVMANDVLQKSKRPEILKLAKNMIASQQAEIDQMKQWRTVWYGK